MDILPDISPWYSLLQMMKWVLPYRFALSPRAASAMAKLAYDQAICSRTVVISGAGVKLEPSSSGRKLRALARRRSSNPR